MKVMKFGGTSLANWHLFLCVANIVSRSANKEPIAVVVSAPAGMTDKLYQLIELACLGNEYKTLLTKVEKGFALLFDGAIEQISQEQQQDLQQKLKQQLHIWQDKLEGIRLLALSPEKVQAEILTGAEKLSALFMLELMQSLGKKAALLDPELLLLGYGSRLDACVDIEQSKARFASLKLEQAPVWVMPGFTACDATGSLMTLGRNGSDYSAAVLSACLNADSCEIWTDVDGIYNTDPHLVNDAKLLPKLSYQEAMEISYFGAEVLHPKTMAPIAQYHIPCYIRNTLNPDAKGTLISNKTDKGTGSIKAISHLDQQTMFEVSGPGMKGMVGMASRTLGAIARAEISISLITQSSSEYSICFCIASNEAQKAEFALMQEFYLELKTELLEPIKTQSHLAVVSLVGDGMRTHKGIAARFFQSLAQAAVNIIAIAQGASERSISAVIKQNKTQHAVTACHQAFFNAQHYLDLFVIGCGNVGARLIEQVAKQAKQLEKQNIQIRICALADSKKMHLNANGIALANWQASLTESKQATDIDKLLAWAQKQQLLNPVLVDCTSSDFVANKSLAALQAGLHVVTPNKKANTRDLAFYHALRKIALAQSRQFLYEATVGAGLPVIDNLKKLLAAGDELRRFTGILSGSLSYIFGKLEEGCSFFDATVLAKENGYTEPDLREDLAGKDVARKLLILAREIGMHIELSDIAVESVLPDSFDQSGSMDSFMAKLPKLNKLMQERVDAAKAKSKVLRYVGEIDSSKCKVSIVEIDAKDPLYSVKNGENALVFYSQYYQPLPFVLRGYGAGAEVTAAGTFADILRTLNWTRKVTI